MPPDPAPVLPRQSSPVLEPETERRPRMIHVLDRLDPEYPNRGLCGRRIARVLPVGEARTKPIDCVVCAELNKTHDWTGPWKP